jgi:hypothetical protein
MLSKIIGSIATIKGKLIAIFVIFLIGMAVGGWLYNKVYSYGKIAMLERYAERLKESHKLNLENVLSMHKKELKIAKDEVRIERVTEYVKDNRECDINADTEQLLDASRTGMSFATPRANGTAIGFTPITQRQQIESCARDGIQYRRLKVQMIGLQQFILDNWFIPK